MHLWIISNTLVSNSISITGKSNAYSWLFTLNLPPVKKKKKSTRISMILWQGGVAVYFETTSLLFNSCVNHFPAGGFVEREGNTIQVTVRCSFARKNTSYLTLNNYAVTKFSLLWPGAKKHTWSFQLRNNMFTQETGDTNCRKGMS